MPTAFHGHFNLFGIDNIAVVRKGEPADFTGDAEGLQVLAAAHFGGGVAHVANAGPSFKVCQLVFSEDVLYKAGLLMYADASVAADGCYAAALLAPVLEALKGHVGHSGSMLYAVDSYDAAFLVDFVLAVHGINRIHPSF